MLTKQTPILIHDVVVSPYDEGCNMQFENWLRALSDSEGESATSVTHASEAYCRGSHYINIEYVFTILPWYKGEGN